MADLLGSKQAMVIFPQCPHLRHLTDNHPKCQSCTFGVSKTTCSRNNTCDFCAAWTDDMWDIEEESRERSAKRRKSRSKKKVSVSSFVEVLCPQPTLWSRPLLRPSPCLQRIAVQVACQVESIPLVSTLPTTGQGESGHALLSRHATYWTGLESIDWKWAWVMRADTHPGHPPGAEAVPQGPLAFGAEEWSSWGRDRAYQLS